LWYSGWLNEAVWKVNNKRNIISVGGHKLIYCCEEHVDLALDMVVDEYETFPVLSKVPGDNLSTGCEYCQNRAVYIVANK
jgi:CxxH/CxxC protein (TIGR04129 family)